MKNLKLLITYSYTIFFSIIGNCIQAQYLSINPIEQNIVIEEGDYNPAYITLINESQYPINFRIDGSTFEVIAEPYINQNLTLPSNGFHNQKLTFYNNTIEYNYTRPYQYIVKWTIQDGQNIERTSIFTVNVIYLFDGECSLNPPQFRNTGNILSTSVVTSWNSYPNDYGYKVRARDMLTGINYNSPLTTNDYYEWNNLVPNRSYYWEVKLVCSDGTEGSWSPINNSVFTTQPSGCLGGASFDKPISSNKDVRVSGSIIAYSTINPNLNVKFRGEQIILRPGFNVKGQSTGVFRAYVDPCSSSKQEKNDFENEEEYTETERVLPSLFPNPTSTILNVENIENITEWKLVDINGKIMNSGIINQSVQNKITINTSMLLSGIYYFNAIMTNGELFQKTIVKK